MCKTVSKRRHKNEKDRLPISQRAAHGVGHVLIDLVANIYFSYVIIYLTKVVELSIRYTGIVILLGQITDGISSPLIGIICDRTVCRYGRRKIWHLIGSILFTITIPLMWINFLKQDTNDVLKLVYYVGVSVVVQFGYGCVQIGHLSLIPEISRRKNERVELNAIRSAVTFLCGIYAYGATWILLGQSSENKITPKVWKEFMYLSFVIVVTGNICNVIFHVVVKEPQSLAYLERLRRKSTVESTASVLPEPSSTVTENGFINHAMDANTSTKQQQQEQQLDFLPQCNGSQNMASKECVTIEMNGGVTHAPRDSVTCNNNCGVTHNEVLEIIDRSASPCLQPKSRLGWLKSPGIYKIAVAYTCSRLVITASQSYFPLYLTDTLNFPKEAIAYFPLVNLVSGLLASSLVKPLCKRLGQKITYIVGGTMVIGACVWFYFQSVGLRNAVYAATVFIGSGASILLVTSLSMIADLVGNDKECGAFIYGAISFIDKVSSGVVILVIQYLNPRDHQVETCLECNEYVRRVQSIVPGVAAVVGVLTVILFFSSNFICKAKVEYRDVGVNVNFPQLWLEKAEGTDNHGASSKEDCLCDKSKSDCTVRAHCSDLKEHVAADTRF